MTIKYLSDTRPAMYKLKLSQLVYILFHIAKLIVV